MNNAGTSAALAEIVHTVIDAYGKLNAGHQRSFEVEGPLDHTIACDPNDLTEIIGNLVDNAAKWSRQQVVIASQDLGTSVCMSVEDDGPGIPEEYRERVFEVGARVDEVKPGTGLGLAIARDLVALYDGRLWIEQSRFGGAALKLVISKRMPAPV
jgi:signal transduction histidine kinase